MKKLLIALMVAGVLGGSVYGAAASFVLSGTDLGADDAVVAACDDLSITYGVVYDPTLTPLPGYVVNTVTVTDPAPIGCEGALISVTLTDGGSAVGTASGTIAAGTTIAMSVATPPAAALVDDVHVASSGGVPFP